MSNRENRLYEFGDFQLDASARLLSRRGATVPLTPKAMDLLLALVEQPGHLLDKETLYKAVWRDTFVEDNNLADSIFKLRRALEDGEKAPRFIETIPKRGYRFVAEVRTVGALPGQGRAPAQQVLVEPAQETEGRGNRVPLPATKTRWAISPSWLVAG